MTLPYIETGLELVQYSVCSVGLSIVDCYLIFSRLSALSWIAARKQK